MLDSVDKQIIEHLQDDARQTASELAEKVGMSVPAVAERIRKLTDHGVISGFTAIVDPKKVGMDVGAFITLISESSEHYDEVIAAARAHPAVIRMMSITGEGSHYLEVRTENTSTLEKLLGEIQAWPGVNRTETHLIMSQYKKHGRIPVADAVIKPPKTAERDK